MKNNTIDLATLHNVTGGAAANWNQWAGNKGAQWPAAWQNTQTNWNTGWSGSWNSKR